MKKIIIIALAIAAIFSCENTLQDYDLPYNRKLVIDAVLTANDTINRFDISLTQPPIGNKPPETINRSKLTAYIESEGERWDIVYKENVLKGNIMYQFGYYPEGLIPKPGRKYDLYVEYDNLVATASTLVPVKPEVVDTNTITEPPDEFHYFTEVDLYCTVKAEEGVVYSASDEWDSEPVTINNADKNGEVEVYLGYTFVSEITQIQVAWLDVYDIQFYDYIVSKKKNYESGFDLFSSSGHNILWNIKGDGIGIFLGRYRQIVHFEL